MSNFLRAAESSRLSASSRGGQLKPQVPPSIPEEIPVSPNLDEVNRRLQGQNPDDYSLDGDDFEKISATPQPPPIQVEDPEGKVAVGGQDEDPFVIALGESTIPEVRKLRFAQFKNRYRGNDVRYAVDVLIADHNLEHEVQQEEKDRKERQSARARRRRGKKAKSLFVDKKVSGPEGEWIHQIRIQSPSILYFLSLIVNEAWPQTPRVFCRPFKLLIHKHKEMRKKYEELEQKWNHGDDNSPGSISPLSSDGGALPVNRQAVSQPPSQKFIPIEDRPEAYHDMKCYVTFMEKDILPLYHQFERANYSTKEKDSMIRFDELWYLYRHGELVHDHTISDAERIDSTDGRQTIWRVYGIKTPEPRYRIKPEDTAKHWGYYKTDDEASCFRLYCYYIDFTGDEYCVVTQVFKIRPFTHEMPISDLNVYPVRFMEKQQTLGDIEEHGRAFLEFIEKKHLSYHGRSLTMGPKGEATTDAEGRKTNHAEFIDSSVIVDFVEAFQTCPSWKPEETSISKIEVDLEDTDEGFPIMHWIPKAGEFSYYEAPQYIQREDGVSAMEWNENLERDRFLKSIRNNEHDDKRTTAKCLTGEDFLLLPKRLYGYVLRDRKFVHLDIRKLQVVECNAEGIENLTIRKEHKKIIRATVLAHFDDKELRRKLPAGRVITQDLITGKGNGTFILLHGVPGVGKTAAAEAMAQSMGKPLFTITCGDLGITPESVERSLTEIFRLANQWDCILLLDEVDTFFSQRTKTDLVRTAIVSVFLRILEYYDGILFMTTNRPGVLDEAFASRIQTSLYFPPLEYEQTMKIWALNLERLKKIDALRCEHMNSPDEQLQQPRMVIHEEKILEFAEQNFFQQKARGKSSIWSGRQIKDAFQSAERLARFEARRMMSRRSEANKLLGVVPPELDVKPFQAMAERSKDFEDYMRETTGKSWAAHARDAGEREDEWELPPYAGGGSVAGDHEYHQPQDHFFHSPGGAAGQYVPRSPSAQRRYSEGLSPDALPPPSPRQHRATLQVPDSYAGYLHGGGGGYPHNKTHGRTPSTGGRTGRVPKRSGEYGFGPDDGEDAYDGGPLPPPRGHRGSGGYPPNRDNLPVRVPSVRGGNSDSDEGEF